MSNENYLTLIAIIDIIVNVLNKLDPTMAYIMGWNFHESVHIKITYITTNLIMSCIVHSFNPDDRTAEAKCSPILHFISPWKPIEGINHTGGTPHQETYSHSKLGPSVWLSKCLN